MLGDSVVGGRGVDVRAICGVVCIRVVFGAGVRAAGMPHNTRARAHSLCEGVLHMGCNGQV